MTDDRPWCEDCGLKSDLGLKCRECYAKWSRRLWADIPRHLAGLTDVAKELNKLPDVTRKAVAALALGKKADVQLIGKGAETLAAVKRVLDGPFKEQLENKLQAIHNQLETNEKASKTRRSSVEEAD